MTDLTTTHLQRLLDQATPGPWEARDSDCITSEHGEVLWNADQAVDWNRNDHDVNLAAHAPQLAEDLIHQLDALVYLIEEVISAAENTNDVETTKHITEAIKTTIEKIKGDHDE